MLYFGKALLWYFHPTCGISFDEARCRCIMKLGAIPWNCLERVSVAACTDVVSIRAIPPCLLTCHSPALVPLALLTYLPFTGMSAS